MDKNKTQCPVCKGSGEVVKAGNKIEARARRRKDIASKLRNEGYTIREIAALMGYKSPSTVHQLLQ